MLSDNLKGAVDACHILSKTRHEFIVNVKKVTGLKGPGMNKSDYIKRIVDSYSD